MSYLSGIHNIHELGTLNPYTSTKVRGNATVIERILKQAGELQGLGDTEGKKIPFSDVVAKYNKGITEPEIKAWVWYKRRMGVPMSGWQTYYLKGTGKVLEEQLFDLVKAGALFYHAGELMPFPIYTYGNMYDRLVQLEKDKDDIEKHFGQGIWDLHKQAIDKAKP